MALTITGTLRYGVEFDGKVHRAFELRLPTIGDNIAAIEEVGHESSLKLSVALLARTVVKLGDIPAEAVDYALLTEHMVDDDYDVLAEKRDALKKKRMSWSGSSPTSGSPSLSSVPTDSPKSASAS